jgi:hypothetical protein
MSQSSCQHRMAVTLMALMLAVANVRQIFPLVLHIVPSKHNLLKDIDICLVQTELLS